MAVPLDVDITLMLTIAEASATFVAIVAGFFTTKIISISNERKGLRSRLGEVDAELIGRSKLVDDYEGRIRSLKAKLAFPRVAIWPGTPTIDDIKQELDGYTEKRNSEQSQVFILDNMKKQYTDELKSSTFPEHMKFGFISQIIFAFLGVVIPLTYASWSSFIGGEGSNIFAISMFIIGLVLTFVYLSLEIRDAIKA